MKYVKFGNTGMDVSQVCLGCMSFGDADKDPRKWILHEESSRPIIKKAIELGINFFDTANVYAGGTSEEYLGRALKDFVSNRDEIVVATKVLAPMRQGPNAAGLSRKAIMTEIDNSLKRLGMDYVDLYIIHRWDYNTPIEETMEALHDITKAGKCRYIGASAMYAWQFQKALYVAEKNGWTKFVSMQNHYNLIYREDERELMPLCRDAKIACTPFSPLANGRLSHDNQTKRAELDQFARDKYDAALEQDRPVIDRLAELAKKRGISRTQLALAWMYHKAPVVAPVLGTTKIAHLEEALEASSISLSDEEIAFLEELYVPHKIVGHG